MVRAAGLVAFAANRYRAVAACAAPTLWWRGAIPALRPSSGRAGCRCGQAEADRGRAVAAAREHFAAVQDGDGLDDRQAQAVVAFAAVFARGVDAIEAIEHALQVLGGHRRALVAHRDAGAFAAVAQFDHDL